MLSDRSHSGRRALLAPAVALVLLALALLVGADVARALPPGSWSSAASMSIPRAQVIGAPLLSNGKVLLAGGVSTGSTFVRSTELYDPATNTWSPGAPMAGPRVEETVTLLQSGKVLVAGGVDNGGVMASAELYDPGTNTWSSAGALSVARYRQAATLLNDGRVLVSGGYNGANVNIVDIYDPLTNNWTTGPPMHTARRDHTSTLLRDGRVLVTGSCCSSHSAEIYDPVADKWTVVPSMHFARNASTASLLPNGNVLVAGTYFGGPQSSTEIYDPIANAWTPGPTMLSNRGYNTATTLRDGTILLVGGEGGVGASAKSEIYDPVGNVFRAAGDLATPRIVHTATLLADGRVLVAGGDDPSGRPVTAAEIYTPALTIDEPAPGTLFRLNTLATGATVNVAGTTSLKWRACQAATCTFATAPISLGSALAPPWTRTVSIAGYPDGPLTLVARAYPSHAEANPVTVIVDRTPPDVTLTTMQVDGVVHLTASASDLNGISWMSFRYCDGPAACPFLSAHTISADPANPFLFPWNWNDTVAPGTYTVLARATDNAGNTADATPVTVTIT